MSETFIHQHHAHCESGVFASLMCHHGMEISESMAFGIGSGLFFSHLPFVKIYGLPLTAYRIAPGGIIRRAARRLGIGFRFETFRKQDRGMAALEQALSSGRVVGLQTSVFWLPFFPPAFRFQFNAHNLIVYGKEGDDYLISDPTLDRPVRCPSKDLQKARYAKGFLAPRGKMYYPTRIPPRPDFRRAISGGIREVCSRMLNRTHSFVGVPAIRALAKKIPRWAQRHGDGHVAEQLANLIRMQEEIGTGGAGFRFLYAAFLQEAGEMLGMDQLLGFSHRMTRVGDRWNSFAYRAAPVCKGRRNGRAAYAELREILLDCADQEYTIFRDLRRLRI